MNSSHLYPYIYFFMTSVSRFLAFHEIKILSFLLDFVLKKFFKIAETMCLLLHIFCLPVIGSSIIYLEHWKLRQSISVSLEVPEPVTLVSRYHMYYLKRSFCQSAFISRKLSILLSNIHLHKLDFNSSFSKSKFYNIIWQCIRKPFIILLYSVMLFCVFLVASWLSF